MAVEGRSAEGTSWKAGGMLRNLRNALDMTADALFEGSDVPSAAKELTNKGIAPPWMYNWIVNRRWKKEARENGVDPKARPLQRSPGNGAGRMKW